MRIGIGTYTFPWALPGRKNGPAENLMPPAALLEAAAGLPGVRVVQMCDQTGAERLDREGRESLKERARELRVFLQLGTRGIAPEHLHRFLEAAIGLGCDLLRTILPAEGPGSSCREAAAMLREVLPGFERNRVLLSLENHDRNLSADLRGLVDEVASPCFGICLDTVNSFGIGEDSRRVLDALAPVTNCFHAKDYRIARVDYGLGYLLTGAPAGRGMLNIPEILERFDRLGRDPDIIIEHWPPFRSSLGETLALEREWAAQGVAFLKGLLRGRDADKREEQKPCNT